MTVDARKWDDLTPKEQERITRLLAVDPDDSLDDVNDRLDRATEILAAPAVPSDADELLEAGKADLLIPDPPAVPSEEK